MNSNAYSDLVRKYRETVPEAERTRLLSDADMEAVSGGVGGANEATCPICGKPMKATGQEFGDGFWICETCGVNQLVSDAEFIEIVKYMEQLGYPGIEYPVWWNQIKK
jgi:hypothetical protein